MSVFSRSALHGFWRYSFSIDGGQNSLAIEMSLMYHSLDLTAMLAQMQLGCMTHASTQYVTEPAQERQ